MKIRIRGACTFHVRRFSNLIFGALLVLWASPARAQETVVNFDPAQAKVEFKLDSTLHTVHGTFKLKSGTVKFDPSTGKASGAIILDAASGESGNEGRDKKMHKEIIESAKYPEIVFYPKEIRGKVNLSGPSEANVDGTIRLHGQDHEMSLTVSVVPRSEGKLQFETHFTVPYIKWGLKNPSTFLLRAGDTVDLEIHSVGQVASPSGSR